MSAWTREAIEALGPTTDVPTTAAIFNVDKDTVYGQIRRDEWTATRVLRLGRKIRIPTLDLIALLYGAAPAAPSPCQHHALAQVTGQQSQSQCGCTPAVSGVVHQLRGA
ncbi:helix-turn-helix domain-containing protein [Streptomyces luteolifulvus]|uniref:Helix-turn-helix domain-containing protein n=1 Tax=Streptomyces luteolifulvus TaxID=2615112 RepID=A0A6H9V6S9_9ACTN|nr:helix-turn-helix domain-containing protein [Streptomyces luteolifulvus]KAB1149247.1 helix-turn-helix domain-containing protein [Streptomyces luteolifulvus]